MSKRTIAAACLMAFAAGWFVSGSVEKPKDRPFLMALAKIAKTALWIAAFAEQPPADPDPLPSVMVDEQGIARINHARGW